MSYIYSIIRKDIPLADQIVQTAHSAFHAGELAESAGKSQGIPHLVLLEIKTQDDLIALSNKLTSHGILHSTFFEPDDDMGYTSLTTVPVTDEQRKLFSNYRLWRA